MAADSRFLHYCGFYTVNCSKKDHGTNNNEGNTVPETVPRRPGVRPCEVGRKSYSRAPWYGLWHCISFIIVGSVVLFTTICSIESTVMKESTVSAVVKAPGVSFSFRSKFGFDTERFTG